jgi:hypothetical protein
VKVVPRLCILGGKSSNVGGVDRCYLLAYPQALAPDVLRTVVNFGAAPRGFGGRGIDPNAALNGVDQRAGIDVLEAAIRLVAHGYRINHPPIERPHSWDSVYDELTPDSDELLTMRERQVLESSPRTHPTR